VICSRDVTCHVSTCDDGSERVDPSAGKVLCADGWEVHQPR